MKRIERSLVELLRMAALARRAAYAPYSKYVVGAAVQAGSGQIYLGTNVENASYSLSICAERVAIFSAIASGERRIYAIAVQGPGSRPCFPCGACRQVLAEFGPSRVILRKGRSTLVFLSQELLRSPFHLLARS